ncbi:hypothetical protein CAEBREN_17047 [Caenorhabditis brenneri]|uniref:Uncharacterized protein n=1 Tax=Caenorhabditis brenneri TaxID=135651 RepID=G0P579_CAEBE|nr:hypothetical protein CAEBREN_17047 [Caenorhabditis brenneri]
MESSTQIGYRRKTGTMTTFLYHLTTGPVKIRKIWLSNVTIFHLLESKETTEVCVLHDIDRKNRMFSGRAWSISTGFSTPVLDVAYRLKYRMRVHFSPDRTACGFESVNHPNWRVYEGRLDSEIETVKVRKQCVPKDKVANKFGLQMTGILDMSCNYHEDGQIFNF